MRAARHFAGWFCALSVLCGLSAQSAVAAAAASSSSPASTSSKSSAPGETTFDFQDLGRITVYQPTAAPRSVALFISGDGGWNLGVVDMARALAARGALVAGVDIRHAIKVPPLHERGCIYPAAQFEQLAHTLEARFALPHYQYPLLVGYSSGATLAYALLLQAPAGTFSGALSLGFGPDLETPTPLCEENLLRTEVRHTPPPGYDMQPVESTPARWIVLQGDLDQVCDPKRSHDFVTPIANAQLVMLPNVGHGYSVPKNWMPQFLSAYDSLSQDAQSSAASTTTSSGASLGDLPLIEVPATGTPGDSFAVILTGDGGWAGLDRGLATDLAARGIPVVGLSTLQYFWKSRTPEQTGADLDRVIRHYLDQWQKQRVLVIGYSMGAEVLPFALNRLSADTASHVALAAALAPGTEAEFEFHLTTWVGKHHAGLPLFPEVERLKTPFVCVYAHDDTNTLCPRLDRERFRVIELPGGHHFEGDYGRLAESLLAFK
ncbi:MAG TPA: AcvB/VirJ family lysyl-phosphatidylglycerol hydrolase [Steroidobacteraceae bacterium]|nr:AcvB/VirJ family lysyl-phosphatidylglycerol hydrolase [Steroidobacteraceae bacterium]